MSRRFLTRSTIEDMISDGLTEHTLGPADVVTDLAREHARATGFRLVREGRATPPVTASAQGSAPPSSPTTTPPGPATAVPAATPSEAVSRQKVRTAVIAALGRVPDGLDAIIDKAMRD